MSQIKQSLVDKFNAHRIVFWYDGKAGWRKDFDDVDLDDVNKIVVEGDELSVKLRVLLDEPEQKFLLYFSSRRPADADNWLLDVLLAHDEFHADRASLTLHELGLAPEFKSIATEHAAFFREKKRRSTLKASLQRDEDHESIRRKLMAVAVGETPDGTLDTVLLQLCQQASEELSFDPAKEAFSHFNLLDAFWSEVQRQYGYQSEVPSWHDFLIELFQSNLPFKSDGKKLGGQAVVFLSRWKDSARFSEKFKDVSARMERDLSVESALTEIDNVEDLSEFDACEVIDQHIIRWLLSQFGQSKLVPDVRKRLLEARKRSFWYEKYSDVYGALEHGAELLEKIDVLTIEMDSIEEGVKHYRQYWCGIDFHYRKFQECRKRSHQAGLLEALADKVEATYVNGFLMPLASAWERGMDGCNAWPPNGCAGNRSFFSSIVRPFLKKKQKLFVIISDALRYECAVELERRLLAEDRYKPELDSVLSTLPSFTQAGMAALLPHKRLEFSGDCKTVLVDGRSSVGSKNREEILRAGAGVEACLIDAGDFLELNSKKEGRELMKNHELIYIMHNAIDSIGDNRDTESELALACADAVEELIRILKKVTNINGNNMVVVSDHGFLFQQQAVEDADCQSLPGEAKIVCHSRRYAFGAEIPADSVMRPFRAEALGFENDMQIGVAKGIQRLRVKGAGKRYVHGGAMPQECIIPVLTVNKARSSDIRSVEVDILAFPSRITTSTVVVRLYQEEPVSEEGKVRGREFRVGFFSKSGTPISDEQVISCDSREVEPRNRELTLTLTLGHQAEEFNDQEVILKLSENIPNTQKVRVYKEATTRLGLPFGSDFDEF